MTMAMVMNNANVQSFDQLPKVNIYFHRAIFAEIFSLKNSATIRTPHIGDITDETLHLVPDSGRST